MKLEIYDSQTRKKLVFLLKQDGQYGQYVCRYKIYSVKVHFMVFIELLANNSQSNIKVIFSKFPYQNNTELFVYIYRASYQKFGHE